MPISVFKTVREVSSEDTVHLAENLLKQQQLGKKWKTKTNGEKSAYVILEFEEPQQIVGIDIGNEYSAFIEVLVSKTGCSPDDFTELLITSSFMTPIESKNGTNTNRVRLFDKDRLVASALEEKWKLLKMICVQPFNKHVQYGLSFIKVHVVQPQVQQQTKTAQTSLVPKKFLEKLQEPTKTFNLGKFKLRQDSTDSESENSISLFKRWQKTRNSGIGGASTAASIREASKASASRHLSEKRQPVDKVIASSSAAAATTKSLANSDNDESKNVECRILDRNRRYVLFGDEEDDFEKAENNKNPRLYHLSQQIELEKKQLQQAQIKPNDPKEKQTPKRKTLAEVETTSKNKVNQNQQTEHTLAATPPMRPGKRLSSPHSTEQRDASRPTKKRRDTLNTVQYRPFNRLLCNVVLVISGIQNPDRAELRRKALELGAKYKADWSQDCTHLICAFKNTPKYNQVRGQGKIVTRTWLEKCYALRKYLPWRRFALESSELALPESDVEIVDEILRPTQRAQNDSDEETNDVIMLDKTAPGKTRKSPPQTAANHTLVETHLEGCETNLSSSDTDDELARVAETLEETKAKTNTKKATNTQSDSRDIYEVTTDEEDYISRK